MKRIGNLYDKICTIENFQLAYKNATKGKKHYKEVKQIEKYGVDLFLEELVQSLIDKTYRVSEYHIFQLQCGRKVREIYKLPMKDRIVQHAIMNYIEPIFRYSFILDTYSSIKGRGLHRCLHRIQKAMKDVDGTEYCLKLDIHKFYPSINQYLMKQILRRKFKDKNLLYLLDLIVDSTDRGLPIGNYTSQYFANYFLSSLDHVMKEKYQVKYYFRYCDDVVILGPNKEYLRNIFKVIQQLLTDRMLELKPNYQIFPVESRGVDFVGYVIRHDYTKVRKTTKINFIKKPKNQKVLGSYWGIFCHANCKNLWNKYTRQLCQKN